MTEPPSVAGGSNDTTREPEPEDPTHEPAPGLPLVDLAVLLELEHDLGPAAPSFARDFIAAVPKRRAALAGALERGDQPAAVDAVLSMKAASAMVGAARLARLAEQVEAMIRDGALDDARDRTDELGACAAATVSALESGYLAGSR